YHTPLPSIPHHLPLSLSFLYAPPHTAPYPLSLHDALPISATTASGASHQNPGTSPNNSTAPEYRPNPPISMRPGPSRSTSTPARSEEHTSELQSRGHLVCRLLLEKKKKKKP